MRSNWLLDVEAAEAYEAGLHSVPDDDGPTTDEVEPLLASATGLGEWRDATGVPYDDPKRVARREAAFARFDAEIALEKQGRLIP